MYEEHPFVVPVFIDGKLIPETLYEEHGFHRFNRKAAIDLALVQARLNKPGFPMTVRIEVQ